MAGRARENRPNKGKDREQFEADIRLDLQTHAILQNETLAEMKSHEKQMEEQESAQQRAEAMKRSMESQLSRFRLEPVSPALPDTDTPPPESSPENDDDYLRQATESARRRLGLPDPPSSRASGGTPVPGRHPGTRRMSPCQVGKTQNGSGPREGDEDGSGGVPMPKWQPEATAVMAAGDLPNADMAVENPGNSEPAYLYELTPSLRMALNGCLNILSAPETEEPAKVIALYWLLQGILRMDAGGRCVIDTRRACTDIGMAARTYYRHSHAALDFFGGRRMLASRGSTKLPFECGSSLFDENSLLSTFRVSKEDSHKERSVFYNYHERQTTFRALVARNYDLMLRMVTLALLGMDIGEIAARSLKGFLSTDPVKLAESYLYLTRKSVAYRSNRVSNVSQYMLGLIYPKAGEAGGGRPKGETLIHSANEKHDAEKAVRYAGYLLEGSWEEPGLGELAAFVRGVLGLRDSKKERLSRSEYGELLTEYICLNHLEVMESLARL